jgi:hypothetical protein
MENSEPTSMNCLRYPSRWNFSPFPVLPWGRKMKYGIYLPPGYSRRRSTYYPVLYLLGGYNMSAAGWPILMQAALDSFILPGRCRKMIIVVPMG